MRRILVLLGLVAAGLVSQGAMWIGCSRPEPPPRPAQLTLEPVADDLYLIRGGGGNTAVLVTDAGVVLVDTKLPGNGRGLLEQVKLVTDKPITTIINTHTHADHVGGNSFLAVADVVAHENTLARMVAFGERAGMTEPHSTPTRTFRDRLVLSIGAHDIELHYFGRGHTDGDVVVVFPSARVAHSGDLFAEQMLPVIDSDNGGSALALSKTLASAYEQISGVTKVITGHGDVLAWKDLGEYAAFNKHLSEWAKHQWRAGASDEDAAARFLLPPAFSHYRVPAWRLRQHMASIFDELQKPGVPPRRWWGGVG